MNVYTLCEHEAVKEQGLTPIGTRWVFTNQGDTEHLFIRGRLVAQETKRTTSVDLTDTSMTFAATPLVDGFRFLLSRAMTGEKKKNPQDELVIAFFDISRAHFLSPVHKKVSIRMQGDPSCPSGIAMLNHAMYGTKDAAWRIWVTATTLRHFQHGLTLLNSRTLEQTFTREAHSDIGSETTTP